MPKRLSLVLAILLLALVGLSACGGPKVLFLQTNPGDVAFPWERPEADTRRNGSKYRPKGNDSPVGEKGEEGGKESPAPNSPDAPAEPGGEPAPQRDAVESPIGMGTAALVGWFNDRVNDVRNRRPRISKANLQKILSVDTTLGAMANTVINPIIQKKMPGKWEYTTIGRGSPNHNKFFGMTEQSYIQPSDVTSAYARQEGGNYVVTLTYGREVNPESYGNSKYSRAFYVATREEVAAELRDSGVNGDPNNATITLHSGKAVITVNRYGDIIKGHGEVYADVEAWDVSVSLLTMDAKVKQSTVFNYSNFSY